MASLPALGRALIRGKAPVRSGLFAVLLVALVGLCARLTDAPHNREHEPDDQRDRPAHTRLIIGLMLASTTRVWAFAAPGGRGLEIATETFEAADGPSGGAIFWSCSSSSLPPARTSRSSGTPPRRGSVHHP